MKPVPWIRLNGSINRRVLDRWLGSVLSECIAHNGGSVYDICKRFSLFVPVDIFLLLEILCDLKCISLIHIYQAEVDIFSSYQNIRESMFFSKFSLLLFLLIHIFLQRMFHLYMMQKILILDPKAMRQCVYLCLLEIKNIALN